MTLIYISGGGGLRSNPVNSVLPSFTGDDEGEALQTGSNGTWDYDNGFTYRWLLDGDPISGATSINYTTHNKDDEAGTLSLEVTAIGDAGNTAAESAGTYIKDQHWLKVGFLFGETGTNTNQDMVDESSFANTINNWIGTAQCSTANFAFGTRSLLLDGNSDYITTPDNALLSVANDEKMCIEARIYIRDLTEQRLIISGRDSAGAEEYEMKINEDGSLRFNLYDVTPRATLASSAGAILINTWYHVAASRTQPGATWRLWIDGTLQDTKSESSEPASNTFGTRIGHNPSGDADRWWDGYIDEIRITQGEERYSANFTSLPRAFSRS